MFQVTYKGATYTYQPVLKCIVIEHTRLGRIHIPIPTWKDLEPQWNQVVPELKKFWQDIGCAPKDQ